MMSDKSFAERGAAVPDPAGVLRELWLLDNSPMPVESWGLALAKADPEDDRVWLGRARNALLTGRFGEAERWLSQCASAGPMIGPSGRQIWTLPWQATTLLASGKPPPTCLASSSTSTISTRFGMGGGTPGESTGPAARVGIAG